MSVDVVTLGCRLNAVESDEIGRRARAGGHSDLAVVNTCAVTAEAVRRSAQAVRRAARERPGSRLVVTGCAAQTEPERFARLPGVAAVIGNADKLRPAAWPRLAGAETGRIAVGDVMSVRDVEPARGDVRVRAFLQVQNGCDHRCTFCVIPFGRGNSRSVPPEDVVAAARTLLDEGAREIVLTGVDITAYGQDRPGQPRLGGLVRRLLRALPALPRLRLSSIDSVEVDPDLLRALAEEPRLMPHLHLSLQAGDDLVLTRMKRRHRRADAVAFCASVRRLRPDTVFGADLIAGFPTETEAMFGRTLDLVAACGLTYLHVFPYSPRPGTPAARMPQVRGDEIRDRAGRLRAAGDGALADHLRAETGQHRRVLVETPTLGRTEGFAPVRFARPRPPGALVDMRILGFDGRELLAA